MTAVVVQLRRWDQRGVQRLIRRTREAGVRTRALIVLHAAAGKGTAAIAAAVGYDPSAVLKVLHRYRAEGEEGLRDHREDNGGAKVDEAIRAAPATFGERVARGRRLGPADLGAVGVDEGVARADRTACPAAVLAGHDSCAYYAPSGFRDLQFGLRALSRVVSSAVREPAAIGPRAGRCPAWGDAGQRARPDA
jgi:hypothetical protein